MISAGSGTAVGRGSAVIEKLSQSKLTCVRKVGIGCSLPFLQLAELFRLCSCTADKGGYLLSSLNVSGRYRARTCDLQRVMLAR